MLCPESYEPLVDEMLGPMSNIRPKGKKAQAAQAAAAAGDGGYQSAAAAAGGRSGGDVGPPESSGSSSDHWTSWVLKMPDTLPPSKLYLLHLLLGRKKSNPGSGRPPATGTAAGSAVAVTGAGAGAGMPPSAGAGGGSSGGGRAEVWMVADDEVLVAQLPVLGVPALACPEMLSLFETMKVSERDGRTSPQCDVILSCVRGRL